MSHPTTERLLPGDAELAMLAGFIDPTGPPPHGQQKTAALVMRARVAAVDIARNEGLRYPLKWVAERCGTTERTLYNQLSTRGALFAFPPPEMASAMVAAGRGAASWDDLVGQVRKLFVALDGNEVGRELMVGLVEVQETYPDVRRSDGYFLAELRSALEAKSGWKSERILPLAGLFTESLRESFVLWAAHPEEPTTFVFDRVVGLLPRPDSGEFVITPTAGG